ncbi:TlpA family protein disulfide reductase [Geopsychrobacter electrodiphilus]|uniref:TlpA family protein disulfide reductase n=1 Tax=Geopsychrobacter electrodiphilus TaxID=225196 RepID=UPI0003737E30|nr:redoxin family protein [Geopsychrobacter electrodiphilus]
MKFCFLLISMLITIGCANPALALLNAGDTAPDFNAQTLDGHEVSLSSFKGKLLLIELGTTWCPACNELAHQIEKIRPFLKKKGVTFISAYLADSAASIKSHLKDEGLKAADETMIDDGEARTSYSIFTIPRLLLIDKDFKIVFDEMMLDSSQLKQRIDAHLQGRS